MFEGNSNSFLIEKMLRLKESVKCFLILVLTNVSTVTLVHLA